jgi:hypothetical protein
MRAKYLELTQKANDEDRDSYLRQNNVSPEDERYFCLNATRLGHLEIVQFLFERLKKNQTEDADEFLDDWIINIAISKGHWNVIKYLLTATTVSLDQKKQLLELAAGQGNLDMVKDLVTTSDIDPRIVIGSAVRNNHLEVTKYLISLSCMTQNDKNYAIHCAAENGHLAILQYLLGLPGISQKIKDETILCAAKNGHLELVKHLVHRSDINKDAKNLAIRDAAENGHLPLVEYLMTISDLDQMAKSNSIRDAAWGGHTKIVKFLNEFCEIDPAQKDEAICDAARNGKLEVIQYLASVNGINSFTKPLAVKKAEEFHHTAVINYLARTPSVDSHFNSALLWMAHCFDEGWPLAVFVPIAGWAYLAARAANSGQQLTKFSVFNSSSASQEEQCKLDWNFSA